MKRMMSLVLAVMMLLSLTACGGEPEPTETTPAQTITESIPETTGAPAEIPTQAPTAPPVTTHAMNENVLVDNEYCLFAVMEASTNEYTGMELQVRCENRTGSTAAFSWDAVSVCGIMYDPVWSAEAAAGETVISTVSIDTYALEACGITSVDEISFHLNVFDSENWMDAPYVSDYFTVYPTGLSAETVRFPQRKPVAEETVIIDNEEVTFIIERADDGDDLVYTLHCYLANKSGKTLMFSWDSVTVNGYQMFPTWSATVAPGKQAYSDITFLRSDLAENGIEDVEEIGFNLFVSDYDDFSEGYVADGIYTYRPTNEAVFG